MTPLFIRGVAALACAAALASLGACGERTQVPHPKADQASARGAMPMAAQAAQEAHAATSVMGGPPEAPATQTAQAAAPAHAAQPAQVAANAPAAPLDDGQIVQALREQFNKDADISAMAIDIDSKDGMVTLSGMVPNSDARVRADQMARRMRDVKLVNNQLEVKAG
jgi:osmotically-inducible protein OsmY